MADRFDIRIPFIHLPGKEGMIKFLSHTEKDPKEWVPLENDVYLNAAEVLRIDSFDDDPPVKHIYMKNGDFYRITTGFTTKCL